MAILVKSNLIFCKLITVLKVSLVWSICLSYSISQDNDNAVHGKSVNASIDQLLDEPSNYTVKEAADIYVEYISGYLMANPDTTYVLYQEMAHFGIEQKMKSVTSQAYAGLAFMHSYGGDPDSNLYYLHLALKYASTYQDSALMMGSIGGALVRTNDLDSASYYIDKSISMKQAHKDSINLSVLFLNKSELLRKQNKYHSSVYFAIEALKLSNKEWTKMKRANAYQVIGDLYLDLGDLKKSKEYLEVSLKICQENGYRRFESEIWSKLGSIESRMGNYMNAIQNFSLALPYIIERNNYAELLKLYSYRAIVHLEVGDKNAAREDLNQGEELIQYIDFEGNKLPYLRGSGKYGLYTKDAKLAQSSFQELYDIANRLNIVPSTLTAYTGLKEVAVLKGDWEEAYRYTQLIADLNSERDVQNQKNLIYDLESKYGNDLKNAEIQRLKSEKQVKSLQLDKRNRQLIFTILALLLAMAAIAGYYYAYRIKKKLSEELELALKTNKMLVKEIHHRVKNNLQVVSSLLNIQSRFETDDIVLKAINSGKYRVQSMSILHQNLYVNEDLTNVNIQTYFTDLIEAIVDGYPLQNKEITLNIAVDDLQLDVDSLVPLGLIANELVTNALKYAYHDVKESYELSFSIREKEGAIQLIASDNGPGLPFDVLPIKSDSMGMQLIQSFSKKLNAQVKIENQDGAKIIITFEKPILKNQISHAAS